MKTLELLMQRNISSASTARTTEAPMIFVVDDMPELTQLYTTFLEATDCMVKAFNDRGEALAALKAGWVKPDLLITDYLGLSMTVDGFMSHCLAVHPTLRILMASGFSQNEMEFSRARPHRFIQKPFTAGEFLEEVRAALAV